MDTNILHKALLELGLSDLESKTYQTLLISPNQTVTSLAKKLDLHRNKVYESLENLAKLKLVNYQKNYQRHIEIADPSKIFDLLNYKESEVTNTKNNFLEILPEVLASFYAEGQTKRIQTFHGKTEFSSLFYRMYQETEEEILFFGNSTIFVDLISDYFMEKAVQVRLDKKKETRLIVENNSSYLEREKYRNESIFRKIRYLPPDFEVFASFQIFGDKIVIWNPVTPSATLIEDKIVANLFRSVFGFMWNELDN